LPDFQPGKHFLGQSQKTAKTWPLLQSGSGAITLTIMFAAGIGALINFDQLFIDLHLLIFTNNFWSVQGNMLLLFPDGFW